MTETENRLKPKKKNKLVSFFSSFGSFLFSSVKRSVGAKTNADFISSAFNLAGGFILAAEEETKEDGITPLSGLEKLEKAARNLVKFYAAQSINFGLHNAFDIVTTKFNQINEERLRKGEKALVNSMNKPQEEERKQREETQ